MNNKDKAVLNRIKADSLDIEDKLEDIRRDYINLVRCKIEALKDKKEELIEKIYNGDVSSEDEEVIEEDFVSLEELEEEIDSGLDNFNKLLDTLSDLQNSIDVKLSDEEE